MVEEIKPSGELSWRKAYGRKTGRRFSTISVQQSKSKPTGTVTPAQPSLWQLEVLKQV